MADPGFISGFIGYAIQLAGDQLIHHINVAVRCRKELTSLRGLLPRINEMNLELQRYQKALNSGKLSASSHPLPATVNRWLNELSDLVEEASDLAERCTVPSYFHPFSRYTMSRNIRQLAAKLEKHVGKDVATVAFLHQLHQDVSYRQGFEEIRQRIDSIKRTAALEGTSEDLFSSTSSSAARNMKYIEETLIVGQDSSFTGLLDKIQSQRQRNLSHFGIVGKGGAGKTLLLKRVFNSNEVQSLFSNDLMLWLTIAQNPSFNALRKDLVKQIGLKVNERLESTEEDRVKYWLNQTMATHKFALFLDDVWGTSASCLLEELCVPHSPHHNLNIVISTSRSRSVLSQLGAPPSSVVEMQDLTEGDSWRLFSFHAFPLSDGVLPMSIDEGIARRVCRECGELPLALKVIGRAMAGIAQSHEWEFKLRRLQKDIAGSLYSRLRLSYDALADVAGHDISLQLCFLCLAAFPEDQVIYSGVATECWIGEGLVAEKNPLQLGQVYVNLLADRCLIEPVQKDYDEKVMCFRVHDVLHDLACQIAEEEEKCFFRAGRGLSEFPAHDCSRHIRISLVDNSLTSISKVFKAPHIRSLLLSNNALTEIPKDMIGGMRALRVLDLSDTKLQSLPKSMGSLKHLVCLRLRNVPIKRLPNSIAALKNLQVLDLSETSTTQLPSGISRLTSLKLLDLASCEHLEALPYGIAHLTSLEYLQAGSSNKGWNKRRGDELSINDLGTLNQLKRLALAGNCEIIPGGVLGSMTQMEHLYLAITEMERLPHDMTAMSELRKLWLQCPQLLEIENSFCQFQHLNHINLAGFAMLKQLPALHILPSLKQLQIMNCPNIETFPEEFGKEEAFPKLEVFSVMNMEKLVQLPRVEEGALPSLKTLTIMNCEALQKLPQCYWDLKSVVRIRVYGCSNVLYVIAEEDEFIKTKTSVQTKTLSTTETQVLYKRYINMLRKGEDLHYGEYWSNEIFQFLDVNHRAYIL